MDTLSSPRSLVAFVIGLFLTGFRIVFHYICSSWFVVRSVFEQRKRCPSSNGIETFGFGSLESSFLTCGHEVAESLRKTTWLQKAWMLSKTSADRTELATPVLNYLILG